ncbi:DegT/DnrJ/EryC1/StrS family aminotransferase [Desulfobaculum bizertense]|uniref:DegT/DnrJ/EryC1/StrS family aminotransferase n=1 Tax=Desulfobaculum bizertense TaxID=376490 RepID=UPI001F363819|nr:DegT/DnrJ/EryC1/StrS family aminotransferase [Desulfobaculum bizertense]UIJ38175.1 DegT/DnrJ/EryC1/StrS family aminotransferase [Desulfobaculum bizertense]
MGIPFNSLKTQLAPYHTEFRQAFEDILDRGWFLMGPEVDAFETEFAAWLNLKHAVTVGNGTDGLILALRALKLKKGDEVILPSHTALPCYHAVLAAGATPVFAEIEEAYYTLSPASVERMITPRTKAVMAVHLYGQCCDLGPLRELCSSHKIPLLEDCAQSHGAVYNGAKAGQTGDIAAFSFYPTKNLGALGDGGAVVCNSDDLAEHLRLLKQYGEAHRYESVTPGLNSRMDEMQAAFLRIRLQHLADETAKRQAIAKAYTEALSDCPQVTPPAVRRGCEHVYHLYVIRAERRDELMAALKEQGIGTAIHYPIPGHRQTLFANGETPFSADDLSITERIAGEILSLPMYPGLEESEIHTVCNAIRAFYGKSSR